MVGGNIRGILSVEETMNKFAKKSSMEEDIELVAQILWRQYETAKAEVRSGDIQADLKEAVSASSRIKEYWDRTKGFGNQVEQILRSWEHDVGRKR